MSPKLAEYILQVAEELDPEIGRALVAAQAEFETIADRGKELAERRTLVVRQIAEANTALRDRAVARLREESKPQGEEIPVPTAVLRREELRTKEIGWPFHPEDYMALKGQGIFCWLPLCGKWEKLVRYQG